MKLTKLASYILFALLLVLGVYLFVVYFPHKRKQNNAHTHPQRQEHEWNIHLEYARMQTYLKHYEEAETEYRKLLEMRPDDYTVKFDLATILYFQKKYEEALQLVQSIPIEKRNSPVLLLMANISLSQHHYTEAETLYREYLQKVPLDREAMMKLAGLLSWQKKYEESIQIYERLLSQDPDNIQVRRQYAKVLIWMGKYAEGAKELQQTLSKEKGES